MTEDSERLKQWRKKNAEKWEAYQKENRARAVERATAWRKANPERFKEHMRAYRARHHNRLLASEAEYRAKHRKALAARLRSFRRRNPWYSHWQGARQRCTNPRNIGYPWYGAKGIQFLLSKEDMIYLWKRDRAASLAAPSLDRIDSAGP